MKDYAEYLRKCFQKNFCPYIQALAVNTCKLKLLNTFIKTPVMIRYIAEGEQLYIHKKIRVHFFSSINHDKFFNLLKLIDLWGLISQINRLKSTFHRKEMITILSFIFKCVQFLPNSLARLFFTKFKQRTTFCGCTPYVYITLKHEFHNIYPHKIFLSNPLFSMICF